MTKNLKKRRMPMPSWQEYKKIAKSRGALALELYVVESTPTGSPELLKSTLPSHLDYQMEMEARGALVLAGPMSDDSGELMEGCGLIVYRAGSFEEARSFAEADPMHQADARSFTLRRWLVNEGTLNVTLSLSGQQGIFS
ncbi:MAG: YciI family protein [Geminicoccaceae bacterium]